MTASLCPPTGRFRYDASMDTISKQKRSEIMSRIKSKDSGIETLFRKELWRIGFRYRKNSRKYFGKPDVVLKKYKSVIFIDSCFWHGCKEHCRMPKSNVDYWKPKIERNKRRDRKVNNYYRKEGWKLLRFWEHELAADLNRCTLKVKQGLVNARCWKGE